jgi:hypothetical protein
MTFDAVAAGSPAGTPELPGYRQLFLLKDGSFILGSISYNWWRLR